MESVKMKKLNEAVKEAYDQMPTEFFAIELVKRTRSITGRKEFDSSILRTLRKIRQNDPNRFGWACIDRDKAIYLKQNLSGQLSINF